MQQYPGQKDRKAHRPLHNEISMPPFFPGWHLAKAEAGQWEQTESGSVKSRHSSSNLAISPFPATADTPPLGHRHDLLPGANREIGGTDSEKKRGTILA